APRPRCGVAVLAGEYGQQPLGPARMPDSQRRGGAGVAGGAATNRVHDDQRGILRRREHRVHLGGCAQLLEADPRQLLAHRLHEGRERAGLSTFDVIILDVRLPGGSGFELCGELRRGGVTTPVLMLTALDAVDDRVRGLEVGADDYLTKPFAFRELLARLKALARRRPALTPAVHRIADLEVDLAARRVRRGDSVLTLSAKEFALLELFVTHPGQVLD